MNGILVDSNVYYLPTPANPEPESAACDVEWPRFSVRLRNAWWRLRLAVAEVRAILRRPRPRAFADDVVIDDAYDAVPQSRPRRSGPARVIDFHAARARLRPSLGASSAR